jgi:hypothetical protein
MNCGSVVSTGNELWDGKIPALERDLSLLKNGNTSSASNQILFQWLRVIYRRVKRSETEFDQSHSSSANVKSECVYVKIYSALCVLMVSTENNL